MVAARLRVRASHTMPAKDGPPLEGRVDAWACPAPGALRACAQRLPCGLISARVEIFRPVHARVRARSAAVEGHPPVEAYWFSALQRAVTASDQRTSQRGRALDPAGHELTNQLPDWQPGLFPHYTQKRTRIGGSSANGAVCQFLSIRSTRRSTRPCDW